MPTEGPQGWHGASVVPPQSSALRDWGELRGRHLKPLRHAQGIPPAASIPPPFGQLRGRLKAAPGEDQGSPSPFRNHFGSSLFASRLARVGGLPQPARFRQETLPAAAVLLKPPPKKMGPPFVWAGPLVCGVLLSSAPQSACSARSK